MTTPSYELTATSKTLDRVYYALKRCKERPELSASAINAEMVAQFGRGLAPTLWTTINAARREGKVDQVSVRMFDFSVHGRKARLGKTKQSVGGKAKAGRARRSAGREAARATRLRPNPTHHPRYSIAVWRNGATQHFPANGKDEARKLVTRLLDEGVPLPDIAVYALEPLEVHFAIRL
jgi:hypothetical protein